MRIARRPLAFAIVYMLISMGTEIVLIAAVGLRIPEDNRFIAPVLLTLPPLLAPLVCGYRRPKGYAVAALSTAVLTVAITRATNVLTGIDTGVVEPIVTRSIAGFLGALIAGRVAPPRPTDAGTGRPAGGAG